ncbi:MAG: isochorismatase family protein [Rhodoblastus sp.]|nr:MAG: isochorismatase family protein [Rhodoblastus sp.]
MPLLTLERSLVLVVDFQARLTPAIAESEARLDAARKALAAARLLGAPIVATEQNPRASGRPSRSARRERPRAGENDLFLSRGAGLRGGGPRGRDIVLMGAETHVCVLQSALELRAQGRRVCVLADAVGSRRAADREAGLARMAREGVEILTAEMAIFEWLRSCEAPLFREAMKWVR